MKERNSLVYRSYKYKKRFIFKVWEIYFMVKDIVLDMLGIWVILLLLFFYGKGNM